MKKLYVLLFCLLTIPAFAQQQLPDNDFENWVSFKQCPGVDSLTGYSTIDQSAYYGTGFCVTNPGITKSTNAESGTYAVSLKPVNFLGKIHGSAFTLQNKYDPDSDDLTGISFTGRPSKLTGYYQFNSGSSNDSLLVGVSFIKNGQEIGSGVFTTGTNKSVYTKFEASIYFTSEEQPDSLIFLTELGDSNNDINQNTSALLDNLVFEYSNTGLVDQLLRTSVTFLQKDGYIQFSEKVANVRISDIIGNTVFETTTDLLEVNVNTLARGLYILTYSFNNQPTSQKIVIN